MMMILGSGPPATILAANDIDILGSSSYSPESDNWIIGLDNEDSRLLVLLLPAAAIATSY